MHIFGHNFALFFRAHGELIKLDINDFTATKSFIDEKRPTYIVHSAAQRFPDQVSDRKS